jgi:hypothetical protein
MTRPQVIGTIVGVAAIAVVIFLVGPLPREDDIDEEPAGGLKDRLEKLRSVPYTTMTPDQVDTGTSGVMIHHRDKTDPGYNIYSMIESFQVNLIDMAGNIVHRWRYPHQDAKYWTQVIMLADGSVVLIEKFKSLMKLDWNSNLIWRREMQAHHDVAPLSDGTFYVCLREVREHRGLRVRFSAIARLTSAGEEIDRWSTYDHLDEIKQAFDRRSFLDTVLDEILAREDSATVYEDLSRHPAIRKLKLGTKFYDYFHLNTITILPDTELGRSDSRFRAGNLLICFRNINQIAVLDRETKEILWVWGEGTLQWPHHPTMVENGNILIFDNGVERKYSRVIELNPITEAVEWEYVGRPHDSFYTFQKGSAQRLPNGNTLISEGDRGRAFEVTGEGEIVWEWFNPDIKGGRRAQVYRMMRLPPEAVEPLLPDG